MSHFRMMRHRLAPCRRVGAPKNPARRCGSRAVVCFFLVLALVATTKLEFPANIYEMTATLDADNNWTLAQELV